ncbi:MAG: ABC transporter permease [Thermoleophilia bacterium]|nr:ABC transporter permease [Thermoleophilia bacterium]
MWAIVVKEFRQLRRDRRTVAMLFLLPFLFLVVFGYAASFDVKEIPTVVVGRAAKLIEPRLPEQFEVVAVRPGDDRAAAEEALRRGEAVVAFVTPTTAGEAATVLIDGSELFAAQAALRRISAAQAMADDLQGSSGAGPVEGAAGSAEGDADSVEGDAGSAAGGVVPLPAAAQEALAVIGAAETDVLYNPDLRTAVIMVPGLCGIILVFVGTIATALGVVRERQTGTMEQLAVMPFRPRDVFIGKIAPYLAIAAIDMAVIVAVGMLLFDVPFRGSVATFTLGSALFLFVTLGLGVLISTVSQTQGQAIQLAIMTMVPQFLLSGLFFPLYAMPWGVRWIGYLLPLTWFVKIARGVMVRGAPIDSLWLPFLVLAIMAAGVFTLSTLRFRRDLAPAGPADRHPARDGSDRTDEADVVGDGDMRTAEAAS